MQNSFYSQRDGEYRISSGVWDFWLCKDISVVFTIYNIKYYWKKKLLRYRCAGENPPPLILYTQQDAYTKSKNRISYSESRNSNIDIETTCIDQ
jgi:hypothetical protein